MMRETCHAARGNVWDLAVNGLILVVERKGKRENFQRKVGGIIDGRHRDKRTKGKDGNAGNS